MRRFKLLNLEMKEQGVSLMNPDMVYNEDTWTKNTAFRKNEHDNGCQSRRSWINS